MTYRYTVEKTDRWQNILLLTLAPVTKGGGMRFTPGQYAALSFKRGYRPTPARCFSIINTPSSGVLQFAIRVGGDFTNAIADLQVGDVVYAQGPFGDFILNQDYDRHVVMLAGGIGITPFLGMIRDATERKYAMTIDLLYSSRSSKSDLFAEPLRKLAARNPQLNVRTFTNDTTGRVSEEHIQEYTRADHGDTTYFICGPKGFTAGMLHTLEQEGVHESRIVVESFSQDSAVRFGFGWSVRSFTYGLSAAALAVAVVGIMALDLIRAVPRIANAQAITTSTTAQSPSASTSTSTGSTSATTPSTSTQTTTPTQNYVTYQQPMSGVS